MGLYCSFSNTDLGYMEHTQDIELYADYSEGNRVFVETFMSEALARCPRDTGYLQSTIGASYTPRSITCWARAHYAQYVEYGTSRMRAQPYFEPALQVAMSEAIPVWQEAEKRAMEKQRELVKKGKELENRTNNFQDKHMSLIQHIQAIFLMILILILKMLFEMLKELLKEIFRGDEEPQPDLEHSEYAGLQAFVSIT